MIIVFMRLCVGALFTALSLLFRIAAKLRLAFPFLYVLAAAVSTLFTDWVTRHNSLTFAGLGVLLMFSALSWLITLIRHIRNC